MDWHEQHENEQIAQNIAATKSPLVARVLAHLGLSEIDMLSEASVEQLEKALQDHRWERRATAATMLGKVGAAAPIGALVAILQDGHEEVRAAAARSLGCLGNAVPPSALLEGLQDSSPLVREAAATALGKVGATIAIELLVHSFQDEHEEVRAAAAQALGCLGNTVPLPALLKVLRDPSLLVREAAATALGTLQNPAARLPLLACIEDEEWLVRDAIGRALMKLERQEWQGLSHDLLRDAQKMENCSVQEAAKYTLEQMRDLGLDVYEQIASIAPLAVALQNVDKGIQRVVTVYLIGRALDVINEQIAVAPLIDLLHQEHTKREEIWKTLSFLAKGILRERKVIQLLMAATNDRDEAVRKEITQAVNWLIELALTLHKEQGPTQNMQAVLQEVKNPAFEATLHYLVKRALEALEEREPLEPLLLALRQPSAQKRAEVGTKLTKRARKALMGRIPGGPLVILLKNATGSTPIGLQFGSEQEGEKDTANNENEVEAARYRQVRDVFPWQGPEPPRLRLPSRPALTQLYQVNTMTRKA